MNGFVCDLQPTHRGGWTVWISETPYRGVETDAALNQWSRQRTGGTYTHGRLVGTRRTLWGATLLAKRAIRRAKKARATYEREVAACRENLSRQARKIETD